MSFSSVPVKEDGEPRAMGNRRASVRYRCGLAMVGRLAVVEKQEFLRAWILDLSARGVGLMVPRPLEVGQPVIITIKTTAAQRKYELEARVARVSRNLHGEWIAGFELHSPLSPDDLDALL